VPSRQACLRRRASRPSGNSCRRSLAIGGEKGNPHRRPPCRPSADQGSLGRILSACTRTPRLRCVRTLCTGRAKSRELECHNEGKTRNRRARKRAVRRLPLPGRPGTLPNAPGLFDRAKLSRVDGVRTHLHSRARGCDSSLLVPWKTPAGVVGNGAKTAANKVRYPMCYWARAGRVRLGVLAQGTPLRS
jgi:hypothetical protein